MPPVAPLLYIYMPLKKGGSCSVAAVTVFVVLLRLPPKRNNGNEAVLGSLRRPHSCLYPAALLFPGPNATRYSLRDQFVEGVASRHLRELLEGSTLSLCRAVALASQVEQANQDIREFASGNVQRISGHSHLALNDHRSSGTRHPSPRDDAPLRAPRTEASLQHDSRQPAS
ncbi:hypothetical protein HPB50_002714 [Hyalomma asiaticum]|uniref:Uncharacterized protein n=1 Tax=Hyalomma asiaticum TaxID=266040 RepID=A0ACB7TB35_HYAAI|nr:hypothetical protein HPB50_002714 [Hyalomma asiaticum]